jgi:Flp pilus assembly protein TadG
MKLFKRFLKSQSGNVAIFFGLSLVPMVVAAGVAIDMSRVSATHTQIQAALDSAALSAAVAKDATEAQRIQIGKDAFAANMNQSEGRSLKPILTFTISSTSVVAHGDAILPTSFMSVIGIDEMNIAVGSTVDIPGTKKAEIAFVLDYSGSMDEVSGTEVKYIAMKKAATKLIDDLSKDNPTKVKFALVPFSHHVYTSLPNAYVLGKGAVGTWTGCTQDRQYPYNSTDATPSVVPLLVPESQWGQAMAPDHAAWGCKGYTDHNLKLRALTNDFIGLKAQLASMTPYAWTHVPLGVEFGYQVLSPNGAYSGAVSYKDKTTQKYMVVLTDGTQTEPAFGPGGVRTVAQGDDNLVELCTHAKASGITMITLAFDLDDSSQRQRLQTCASDPATNFFVATTSDEMAKAFDAITQGISQQAFLSQ